MIIGSNLGYPRIGENRELKKALEKFWKRDITIEELKNIGEKIRTQNWDFQKELGITQIPSNDFSFYDHVLDTATLLGAIPDRFGKINETNFIEIYFSMARGKQSGGRDIKALEMTKWFNTNYHYIVPEIASSQHFKITNTKIFDEFIEAKEHGIITRPVIIGPFSFLMLSKPVQSEFHPLDLIHNLVPVYAEILSILSENGAEWIQIDEPFLTLDLEYKQKVRFRETYQTLGLEKSRPNILLTTYFEGLGENLQVVNNLQIEGIHLDLVSDPSQLESVLDDSSQFQFLSLGLIDGRNIWKTDLDKAYKIAKNAASYFGDKLFIAPSCSLMHIPQDVDLEENLDDEVKEWLAFTKQKLEEIVNLTLAINSGKKTDLFERNRIALDKRAASMLVHSQKVAKRMAKHQDDKVNRIMEYAQRKKSQQQKLDLPLFPTTTIGSFPQTTEVRKKRAAHNKEEISKEEYEKFLEEEIEKTIRFQEECGLDVLVHGEFERNDMVQYFGEQLSGFAFTNHGWVQSFGSRYVRPPIIYGDISRPKAMTVKWSTYAQSLTNKPVKGMLTGPVTILKWSFVRDDQPRSDTCRQIAFALQDEVKDLQKAGIKIIQIDEPAFREGLPLRKQKWAEYLKWAIECFHICTSVAIPETQIHTHMCYAEFNDIIESIAALDADVISIEAARSKMELLNSFAAYHYPNNIGPGVYDIHSPRIPTTEEMYELLHSACKVLRPEQLWVNPDCGLKTRQWKEVKPALENMVKAAEKIRKEYV